MLKLAIAFLIFRGTMVLSQPSLFPLALQAPLTFTVATHPANPVPLPHPYKPPSAEDLLEQIWAPKSSQMGVKELLQSSITAERPIIPRRNGFVNTVVDAYSNHHHLVLRPDDVWIAILTQFSAYVNAHAEELRSYFVPHKGKKKLEVKVAARSRYSVDFGSLATQMTEQIHLNVVDESLTEWILPNFTTTSHTDTVVSAVTMMATLKTYFSYNFELSCGLPSVTLEGQKSDWESLLARLDKLATFGEEPGVFASLLRPILTRFVGAFTNAETGAPQDLDFWGRISRTQDSVGFYTTTTILSGWITAFCVWDSHGEWMGPKVGLTTEPRNDKILLSLQLDGIFYSSIDMDDVPVAFSDVDVKLDDNGEEFECMMVSGLMGSSVEGERRDTVRPLPAWFMFIKEERQDPRFFEL